MHTTQNDDSNIAVGVSDAIAALQSPLLLHMTGPDPVFISASLRSKRTALVPAMLHKSTGRRVLVLVPHRFQAIAAMELLADLAYPAVIAESRGQMLAEDDATWPDAVVFTTYGHALSDGLLAEADVIILDDAQCPQLDVTLCKAVLKNRLVMQSPGPKLVCMMSLLISEEEEKYWNEEGLVTTLVTDEPCAPSHELRRRPQIKVSEATMDLVDEGRSGILVFVPGLKEVKETAKELARAIELRKGAGRPIEIAVVHNSSNKSAKDAALLPPTEGAVKILIGTKVLEAGYDYFWVDAGVSSGTCRQRDVLRDSGAIDLRDRPLCWTAEEAQASLIHGVDKGVFVLCGRSTEQSYQRDEDLEIVRLPLYHTALRCAQVGIDPMLPKLTPKPLDYVLAREVLGMHRLGLIDDLGHLTEDGELACALPLGPEAVALLCHARRLNIVEHALFLVAVLDGGGLRHERRQWHGFDNTSDLLDEAKAFSAAYRSSTTDHKAFVVEMDSINVNWKRFTAISEILSACEKLLGVRASCAIYEETTWQEDPVLAGKLRQCILAANLNKIGSFNPGNGPRNAITLFDMQQEMAGWSEKMLPVATGCVLMNNQNIREPVLITARSRNVVPRHDLTKSFDVAENITVYELEDVEAFSAIRHGVFKFYWNENHPGDRGIPSVAITAFGRLIFKSRGGPNAPIMNTCKDDAVLREMLSENTPWAKAAKKALPAQTRRVPTQKKPDVPGSVAESGPVTRSSLAALAAHFSRAE